MTLKSCLPSFCCPSLTALEDWKFGDYIDIFWRCNTPCCVAMSSHSSFCVEKHGILHGQDKKNFRTHKVGHWDDGHRVFSVCTYSKRAWWKDLVMTFREKIQAVELQVSFGFFYLLSRGFPQKCDGNLIHKLCVTFEGSLHVPTQRWKMFRMTNMIKHTVANVQSFTWSCRTVSKPTTIQAYHQVSTTLP